MTEFKPFLEGEIIHLRQPELELDILQGNWHEWFNNYKTTQFLVHGLFPISREEEFEVVKENIKNPNNLILTIAEPSDNSALGVIALKDIDRTNRRAEISIVMGGNPKMGSALEAMALLTQHSFDRLNLEKLYAGQHEGLWKWVNILELIGYQIEGYRKGFGRRDCDSYGVILTGVTVEKFNTLRKERNGKILGNNIFELLKKRCKKNRIPQLSEYLDDLAYV